jgi:RNA-directed DNA polymerase
MTNPDETADLLPQTISCRRPRMERVAGPPGTWPVPRLPTPGRLADWVGVTPRELDWFADCKRLNDDAKSALRHYTLRWLKKSSGRYRLLEVPKSRLKAIQRQLLDDLLAHVPPHDAAHAFRTGRSLVGFAAPHAGQRLVLRLDLHDFFPSVRATRVHALFRRLGYPIGVARLLTGLCTHSVAPGEWPVVTAADTACRQRCALPHLPQGAPTSPALANLCAWRFDTRLAALAVSAGAKYTRYADDLAFSGGHDFERAARRFQVQVMRIALEEGFEINARKTRFMRPGVRQQLCGVVLNTRPNIRRDEFDRLKAILHNCVKHGPNTQNRAALPDFRAHLLGRIGWVEHLHPARGVKLRAVFNLIAWDRE